MTIESSKNGKKGENGENDLGNTPPNERLRRLLSNIEEENRADDDSREVRRHPTGTPEATGGWFGEIDVKKPTPPSEVSNTQRHPTGTPDETGGWYGEVEFVSLNNKVKPETISEEKGEHPSTDISTAAIKKSDPGNTTPQVSVSTQTRSAVLPHRVDEVDQYATQVVPSAIPQPSSPAAQRVHPSSRFTSNRNKGKRKRRASEQSDLQLVMGCLLKLVLACAFFAVLIIVVASSVVLYQYFTLASTLPDVGDLSQRASQFETTRIMDREGNLLYEVLDPNAGRRTYVKLEDISPYLIAATIATEDKEYYNHPGFDPVAMLRALWQNYTNQEIVSGASTITQQLARTLLLSAEERTERTYQRKAREIILAAEITRRYSKEEILELFLNENFYGNLSYGIEPAAETYFHTTADRLTLSQSAFLAGIPQAPAVYDIFTNPEATLGRMEQVLVLMYEASMEKNCIYVSTNVEPVCVEATDPGPALQEIKNYEFTFNQNNMVHPHWVNYVRSILESMYDAQTIYRSGFTVYTTLDPDLQNKAETLVRNHVAEIAAQNVTGGALVAIRPTTGEILAMVGSPDYNNENASGQVNMAISPRQPGSSIKPLTYTAAFEKGLTPSTLIWDIPSRFTPSGIVDGSSETYEPVNYDGLFHGPVTVRSALANSYNIPAVKTLQFVGIYDDASTAEADGFINFARRMGITTLNAPDYGLSLTLGGGDVPLLELTGAYAIYANNGSRIPPIAILKIIDYAGETIYEYQTPAGNQVIRPEHAYLINSILSDNEARSPMFGTNSVLNLPFQAAAKTGTTNNFRDNWTIGYTPDLAVGVWGGNPDYTPMQDSTGLTGAAPIWSEFMQFAVPDLTNGNPSSFVRPNGITDKIICSISGTEPSQWCTDQRGEVFAHDQLPASSENDFWKEVQIDTWTGLLASAECSGFEDKKMVLNITDTKALDWVRNNEQGRQWAANLGFSEPIFFIPERECRISDSRPNILFAAISENELISENPLDIYALVNASSNFGEYRLEYGLGNDPAEWKVLLGQETTQTSNPERIYTWDLSQVPAGNITLRIYMKSTVDTYAEKRIHLNIQVPTVTPTITLSPTVTMTITQTPTHTLPPDPTRTQTITETPTPSLTPTVE